MIAMASRSVSGTAQVGCIVASRARKWGRLVRSRLLPLAFIPAAFSLTHINAAYATPITVSFDDLVQFNALTDTITGTATLDPVAETFASDVSVAGDIFPGNYTYSVGGVTSIPFGIQYLGTLSTDPNVSIEGFFSPVPFSSSSVFTGFLSVEFIPPDTVSTFESTSVTAVAVPEPSTLALLGTAVAGLISFGLLARRRDSDRCAEHPQSA
jgi:hypothetical protein